MPDFIFGVIVGIAAGVLLTIALFAVWIIIDDMAEKKNSCK